MIPIVEALLSAAAGTIAVEIVRWISSLISAAAARTSTEQAAFEAALNSDDIKTVSAYLNDRLGDVDMSTYVENSETRERVDTCLRKITAFLEPADEMPVSPGSETETPPNTKEIAPKERWGILAEFLEPNEQDPPIVRAALADLRNGETWNALARLRRDVDQRLRAEVPGEKPQPAYRLALQLEMPNETRWELTQFYRTASAAIHGEDIDLGDALTAVSRVRKVYEFLDHPGSKKAIPKKNSLKSKKKPT